jgi:hypothetical protein
MGMLYRKKEIKIPPRPRDKSSEAYKKWMQGIMSLTAPLNDMAEDQWRKAWRKFWKKKNRQHPSL